MTEFRFLPGVNLMEAAEKAMKTIEEQKKEIRMIEENEEHWIKKAVKLKRMNNILLQLTYDYLSLLETLPDDHSQERLKHVSNILRRMENDALSTSTETEPQPENAEKEGPKPVLKQDYRGDH